MAENQDVILENEAAKSVDTKVVEEKSRKNPKKWILGAIFPIVIIILWEILARLGVFQPYQLPAPTIVFAEFLSLLASGELWEHIYTTVLRVFAGFGIGSLVAVIVAIFVGLFENVEYLLDPTIQAFRSIPSMAWVPLFILWMGIGEWSKITMIAVGVFFPVYLNLTSGILNVDQKLIEVGKMNNLSKFDIVRKIILPAAFPSFLVGLRSGLGLGWMFVVAAELMGASSGLGYLLTVGQNTLSPETILVSIVLFAIIGKISDWILKLIGDQLITY